MICVPSITHSGTHLLRHIVLEEIEQVGFAARIENGMMAGHLLNASANVIRKACEDADKVYTPLRHPVRIWASFKKKGAPWEYYMEQWGLMVNMLSQYSPTYFHTDIPELRVIEAASIRKELSLPTKEIDWTPRKETGCIRGTHTLEVTPELEAEIPSWILEFYNSTL
jgi:hypothetical protein